MVDGMITYPGGTISSSTCVQFTLDKKSSVRLGQEFKEHVYRDPSYQMKAVLSTDEKGQNVICAYDENGPYILPLYEKQVLEAGTYYYTISWSIRRHLI